MDKVSMTELVYTYRLLREVKNPSKRVKEMLAKLEDHLHHGIMNLKTITAALDPPL